jgi:CBS domain containing-hemolysin-like protein
MTPLLLFLLAIAAVYVGTIETAFSALMRLSLRLMAERGGRDDRLGFYLEDPIQLFVPARLLLGIIFSLATTFIAILTGAAGLQSIGMLMLFVAIFILVCEHVVPMFIVRRNPERVLEILLPPFDFAARLIHPLTGALVRLIVADARRDRVEATSVNGAPAESRNGDAPRAYVENGAEQGLIEGDERRLLQSIVDFGDTLVREVMTPRPDMVAIRADATLDELRAFFREQEYSRIPVYKENLDNIVGIVFVKDLIRLTDDESGTMRLQQDLARLVRPATFVPETKRVPEMLKEFQRKQVQIAIVVDEYGGTAGLVTIEDLLEEIVGEIRDEYDVETEPIVDEGDGAVLFSAKVNIAEVRERLGVEIEPEGFETVGGYVLTRVGRVPAVGETFELDGLLVEVLEAERRRIHKVRVRLAPSPVPEPRGSLHLDR